MALDPQALVTTDEARTYLGIDKADKPTDALLEQIIGGLSIRVGQRTGRTYINPTAKDAASVRQFRFEPTDNFCPIDDCRAPAKVEVTAMPGDVDGWIEVGSEMYALEPLDGPVFDRIRFLAPADLPAKGTGWGALGLHLGGAGVSTGQTPWPHQARSEITAFAVCRLSAKWGFGPDLKTVPANVKLALLMWLQNIHKRDMAFFTEAAEVWASLAMPKDVQELLDGEEANRPSVVAV